MDGNRTTDKLKYFSDVRIALQREVKLHPKLLDKLEVHPVNEFEIRLAEIAAYCNIVLDDLYTEQDIDDICGLCLHKLQAIRGPIIVKT